MKRSNQQKSCHKPAKEIEDLITIGMVMQGKYDKRIGYIAMDSKGICWFSLIRGKRSTVISWVRKGTVIETMEFVRGIPGASIVMIKDGMRIRCE